MSAGPDWFSVASEPSIRSACETESAEAELHTRICQLREKLSAQDLWYADVLQGLWRESVSEFSAIRRDYQNPQDRDVSLLAWRARNILELVTWCMHCVRHTNNARRLYEDAGRDVRDIAKAFLKWGTLINQPKDWVDGPQRVVDSVESQAQSVGIESLDGPFVRVSDAAKDCGFDASFAVANKLFSKLAHPTAMMILGALDEGSIAKQRDAIFGNACVLFLGTFEVLDRRVTSALATMS